MNTKGQRIGRQKIKQAAALSEVMAVPARIKHPVLLVLDAHRTWAGVFKGAASFSGSRAASSGGRGGIKGFGLA